MHWWARIVAVVVVVVVLGHCTVTARALSGCCGCGGLSCNLLNKNIVFWLRRGPSTRAELLAFSIFNSNAYGTPYVGPGKCSVSVFRLRLPSLTNVHRKRSNYVGWKTFSSAPHIPFALGTGTWEEREGWGLYEVYTTDVFLANCGLPGRLCVGEMMENRGTVQLQYQKCLRHVFMLPCQLLYVIISKQTNSTLFFSRA